MEHAPAERAEQPLPEEQEQADGDEEGDEDEAGGREAAQGERPEDLALDLVRLGLGELDVRADDPDGRRACRRELGHQAGRRLGGGPRRVRVGRFGIQGSSSAGWAFSFGGPSKIIAAPDGPTRRVRSHDDRSDASSRARACPSRDRHGGAPRGRHGAHGRRDDRHQQRRARPLAGGPRRDRRPDLEPARRPRGRRGRAAHGPRPGRPRRDDGRPRTHAGRPDPRGGGGGVRRDAGRSTRRRSSGCAGLWARRRQPFPETNRKQAWVLPSGAMLANPNGTAPGWWVDRPDGRVIVTLPGPPREMRPMWADEVVPRLAGRGVGVESEVRTLRLTGIGESVVAELLGEPLLRAREPDRRDLCPPGGGGHPDLGACRGRAFGGRARGRGRGRGPCRPRRPTSGRAATRPGRARSREALGGAWLDPGDGRGRARTAPW